LYAAKTLRDNPQIVVTLADKRNFHLFQPLLYQVATGALSPGDIAAPLRSVFRHSRNVEVLLAEATDFDIDGKRVLLGDGQVPYDTLIVATGADNSYFGNTQWEEYAPGLKSIEDATRMRHKILYAFEAAERESDPVARRAWLTFVVVGAGPTGVELAGTLGEIANDVLKDDFRSIRPEEARILLLDGSPRVLPPFPEDLSAKAEKQLIDLGVRSRNSVRVTKIDANGVTIHSDRGDERIESHTVLWAAGVRATAIVKTLADRVGVNVDKGGRIACQNDCTIPGHPEIFVIGDVADFKDEHGNSLPGVAPVAMQQGRYVAKVILQRIQGKKDIKPFHYFDKGTLAVIGRKAAVAKLGTFHFSGIIAWLLWLFVHLMYLVSFQNRLIVFIRWGFSYFTYNRGARLITGKEATEDEKRLGRLLAHR
jgi:NADH dehydrogenase